MNDHFHEIGKTLSSLAELVSELKTNIETNNNVDTWRQNVASIEQILIDAQEKWHVVRKNTIAVEIPQIQDIDLPSGTNDKQQKLADIFDCFAGSNYEKDYKLQNYLFDCFCSASEQGPMVKQLKPKHFDDSNGLTGKWTDIWPTYVNLHLDLKDCTNLPLNTLQEKELISFNRDSNCYLPDFQIFSDESKYEKINAIISYFDENNAKELQLYFLLWNGFVTIFDEEPNEDDHDGSKKSVSNYLSNRVIGQIHKMGDISFDNSEFRNEIIVTGHDNSDELLFNKNDTAKKWLFDFVADKVTDMLKEIIDDEDEDDDDDDDDADGSDGDEEIDSGDCEFGARYYIAHYFTIILYHLFIKCSINGDNNNNNNNNGNKNSTIKLLNDGMKYKNDLELFYKLMCQFSIYNACYPREKTKETFYSRLFVNYRDHSSFARENELDDQKENESKNKNQKNDKKRSNIFYFSYHENQTLLHGATCHRMFNYAQSLLRYGFDVEYAPFDVDSEDRVESAYDFAIRYPSKIHDYYYSVLLRSETYDAPKDIEKRYFSLKQQTQFGKLFCHYLGCYEKHPAKESNANDPLFYKYNQCGNIKPVTSKTKKARQFMKLLSEVCVQLILQKQPLSDDLLVLCYDYCYDHDEKMSLRLQTALETVINECLHPSVDLRSKEWFNKYIVQSNVVFLPKTVKNKQNSKNKNKNNNNNLNNIPYKPDLTTQMTMDAIGTDNNNNNKSSNSNTNPILKRFIEQSKATVENDLLYSFFVVRRNRANSKTAAWFTEQCQQRENNEEWNMLLKFEMNNMENVNNLRQDGIENIQGVKDITSYVKNITPEIDEHTLAQYATMSESSRNFPFFEEYNTRHYLTKCLVIAQTVDSQFHNTMIEIVSQMRNKFKSGQYRQMPVKSRERCVNHCDKKFHFEAFPNAAKILDYVRGSIKFETEKEMLEGIDYFIDYINKNGKNTCIRQIVGCTNGFNQLMNRNNNNYHNNENEFVYCDIKFNVLIHDKKTNNSIIGEVQFVLDWMLTARKMTHKFKFIENQMNYVAKVYDRVLQGQRKFRRTIEHIMCECDYDSLVKYMLFFENRLLSMLNYDRPLLYECCKHNFYKGFYFFRDSINHFSNLLGPLDEKQDGIENNNGESIDFETKYFTSKITKTIDLSRGLIWGVNVADPSIQKIAKKDLLRTILGIPYSNDNQVSAVRNRWSVVSRHGDNGNATNNNDNNNDNDSSTMILFAKVLNYQSPSDKDNNTILMTLIEKWYAKLNIDFLQLLLAIPGINLNIKNSKGYTAIDLINLKLEENNVKNSKKQKQKKQQKEKLTEIQKALVSYETNVETHGEDPLTVLRDKFEHQLDKTSDVVSKPRATISTKRLTKFSTRRASRFRILRKQATVDTKQHYAPSAKLEIAGTQMGNIDSLDQVEMNEMDRLNTAALLDLEAFKSGPVKSDPHYDDDKDAAEFAAAQATAIPSRVGTIHEDDIIDAQNIDVDNENEIGTKEDEKEEKIEKVDSSENDKNGKNGKNDNSDISTGVKADVVSNISVNVNAVEPTNMESNISMVSGASDGSDGEDGEDVASDTEYSRSYRDDEAQLNIEAFNDDEYDTSNYGIDDEKTVSFFLTADGTSPQIMAQKIIENQEIEQFLEELESLVKDLPDNDPMKMKFNAFKTNGGGDGDGGVLDLKNEIRQLKQELGKKQRRFSRRETELQDFVNDLQTMETMAKLDIQAENEKNQQLSQQVDELTSTVQSLTQQLTSKQRRFSQSQSKMEEFVSELKALEAMAQIDKLTITEQNAQLTKQVEQLQAQIEKLNNELTKKEKGFSHKETKLHEFVTDLEALEAVSKVQITNLRQRNEGLTDVISTHLDDLRDFNESTDELVRQFLENKLKQENEE